MSESKTCNSSRCGLCLIVIQRFYLLLAISVLSEKVIYTLGIKKIVWAWWATARGVTKSRIRLSDWHFAFSPQRPSPRPHTPACVRVTVGVCCAREGVCALSFLTWRKVTCYKCHCVSFFQLTIYLKHGSRWRHTDLPGYYNGSRCSAAQSLSDSFRPRGL